MTDRLPPLVDSKGALDLLAMYRHLDDLVAEANAVDTMIGRPQVLRERLLQLRDAVGSIKIVSKQADEIERLTRQVDAYRLRCEALHSASREPLTTHDGLRPVAWRFRFPTGGRWHYTEHGPNTHSKPELTWEPLYGHATLSASVDAQCEPLTDEAWAVLGRFFKTWVGSSLYDGGGAEVDLEEPYEAFRALHARQRAYVEPLTDEQIDALWKEPMSADWEHREFARAIERAHGIGADAGDAKQPEQGSTNDA